MSRCLPALLALLLGLGAMPGQASGLAEPAGSPLMAQSESDSLDPRNARARLGQIRRHDFEPEDVKAELDFGREVAARLMGRHTLDDEQSLRRYVALVGHTLTPHANRPELDFHFGVLETDIVSAYAAPGGYVMVSRGAIRHMDDEAELAGVLAHEIVHITERHIIRELDIRGKDSGAVSGLARIIGGSGDPAQKAFSQAVDQALDILLEKGLEREDELEADRLGALLATQAGYDGQGLERFLARVAESGSVGADKGLAKTHPPFEERVTALQDFAKRQGIAATDQPRVAERFHQHADL